MSSEQSSVVNADHLARDRDGNVITEKQAWSALWALLIGFFMILVDTSIVTTALPATIHALNASLNQGVWITSAYLLTYAVPLLITGRMGDRWGQRRMHCIGMFIFGISSLACGFSPTIGVLIAARAVQGIGAGLMTPQSLSIITRLFPPEKRGAAMGVWGATAGVASFVGPVLGGILVDTVGWEWIFFVNVPVSVIGLWLAVRNVPVLETHGHAFDWLGVILSGIGMTLLVFGIQEGEQYNWGAITGVISVPLLITLGVVFMVLFVISQTEWSRAHLHGHSNEFEPLVPLRLFTKRNFTLGNVAISLVGMLVNAYFLPTALYLQDVRGKSPTIAALLLIPTAIFSGVLSPFVGRFLQRRSSGRIAVIGVGLYVCAAIGWWLLTVPSTDLWVFSLLAAIAGIGSSMMWSPISLVSTDDLGQADAGAGSGVHNAIRQVGAVLGSAFIAMMMDARIAARHDMGRGLGESMFVTITAGTLCVIVCAFFANFQRARQRKS
ncbi:DHA2 family efflux MFS transporter permease subunit [Cutibacterium sp.]|uniref:DHA2 family efflux MFS transporter permease subunit n=1 Tax=Cutibacterium sp. TaxID=1912221 RepID=UPI0026DC6D6A|nr:DHA2 family efflux MFS transporter permease subunit [Cutibacterium sp.]MDO4412780.1 DHA2 family efflux MFS transporter permease subunit [Cutibacterium sp.]